MVLGNEEDMNSPPIADGYDTPRDAAETVGLVYVSDDEPGISRRKAGRGFCYRDAVGRRITDPGTLARIRKLAIPPAYTDVWICARPNGHIQATGRDARGRKQYRYHVRFREIRDNAKYGHMLEFAEALPDIRQRVAEDMARRGLPREKVLAAIIHLLETTMIRIGNEDYVRQNGSYGLTTLQSRHVNTEGTELRFSFKGKGGKRWRLRLRDRRVARIVRNIQDLPGQRLFQYLDEEGEPRDIGSADVNGYLQEISGKPITAKDFRTWAGTITAATMLAGLPAPDIATARRNLRQVVEHVSTRLGNTPAICRKCYIHPEVLDGYLASELVLNGTEDIGKPAIAASHGLAKEEMLVLSYLRQRAK